MTKETTVPTFDVLGIKVAAVQIADVIELMQEWIKSRDRLHWIAVTGMHGTVEAQDDPEFKEILNSADLVVPDGTPLVWLGRKAGFDLPRRVYGPELMETFCSKTGDAYRHFLFGGGPGVADRLAELMSSKFHNEIAGTYTPPFGNWDLTEMDRATGAVSASSPDIVWVGLSTPKQERWIYEASKTLASPVAVGVGAAFDFLTGNKPQAPKWMRENGLEWFYRLSKEPSRLAHRYIVGGSRFIWMLGLTKRGKT